MIKETFKELLAGFGDKGLAEAKVLKAKADQSESDVKLPAIKTKAQLDLHGQGVDVALENVRFFIDECQEKAISKVEIVTGKGTGKLMLAVEEYLKDLVSTKEIKSFKHLIKHSTKQGAFEIKL